MSIVTDAPPCPHVPVHWPVNLREYHADRTCESNSTLGLFVEDRWAYYRQRILGLREDKSSDAMALGTALHTKLLTPERWDDDVLVMPDGCTRGNKAGRAVMEKYPDRACITSDDELRVDEMLKAIRANAECRKLLDQIHYVEHPIKWVDAETGIGLKCSFDILLADGTVVDVKTASNPRPTGARNFLWAIGEYGYDRQAGLYCHGRDLYRPGEFTDDIGRGHKHLVVGSEPGDEAMVYRLPAAWVERGYEQIRLALSALRACLDFADMPEVWHSPCHGQLIDVSMPTWLAEREVTL